MDARTQVEYDRIKAGPHEGEFSFLHHAGPVVEKSYDVMERVDCIVTEKAQKETPEQIYTRLRHIYWIDTLALLPECQEAYAKWQEAYAKWQEAYAKRQEAYAKRQEAYAKWQEAEAKRKEADAKWQEAEAKRQEAYAKCQEADAKRREADAKWQETYAPFIIALIPNCGWDGKTIFG